MGMDCTAQEQLVLKQLPLVEHLGTLVLILHLSQSSFHLDLQLD